MKLVSSIKRHSNLLSFLLSFLFIVIALVISTDFFSDVKFYWDSNYYLELSQSFLSDGDFSFINYPLSIRGYLWPFILLVASNVLSVFSIDLNTSALIIVSIFYAFSFSVTLPKVVAYLFKREFSSFYGVVITLIVLIYWIGLVRYPLTDLYSFCLILSLIYIYINTLSQTKIYRIIICGILVGALSYAIYNARSSVGLFSILLIGIIFLWKSSKWSFRGIIIVSMAFGILTTGTPQVMVNNHHGNGANLALHSDNYNGSGENLVLYQLRLGISYNRYDTLVESAKELHQTDAYIEYNQAGVDLLTRYQLVRLDSYFQYLKLVVFNPVDFLNVYGNHFKTMLDARYGEIYIENYDDRYPKLFINYAIWTFAIIYLINNAVKAKKKKILISSLINHRTGIILCVILPSILAFPGVPEYRFFFPIYMIIYVISLIQISDYIKITLEKIKN